MKIEARIPRILSKKNQVSIPQYFMTIMKWKKGDLIMIYQNGNKIIFEKVSK